MNRFMDIVINDPTEKVRMSCIRREFKPTPVICFPRHLPQEIVVRVSRRKEDRRFQRKSIVKSTLDETLHRHRFWLHVRASD